MSNPHAHIFAHADTLLPLIKEAATQSEHNGQLSADLLSQLCEHDLFRLYLPKDLGGHEVDLSTSLEIFERIAYADGSTGWLVMIGSGGNVFSGFLNATAAAEVFKDKRSIIAGSGALSGTAKKVDGGYEVSGRWGYASGSLHANWFTANCVIEGTENQFISVAVPSQHVTLEDTWNVFGMAATGSHDFSMHHVFVPDDYTFDLLGKPRLHHPIFHCPLLSLASLTFASVALGIALHALEAFVAYAQHKKLSGTDNLLIEQEAIKKRIEKSAELISNSRLYLYDLTDRVWQSLQNEHAPDAELIEEVDQAGRQIVSNTVLAVEMVYPKAGMMPLYKDSEFGRAWRDLRALSQHSIIAPK